jgi:signal transduction histidine kinase
MEEPRDSSRDPLPEPLAEPIARLESLRHLALGASHSLNNALTSILGGVRTLLDARAGEGQVARVCSEVEREVERCARLTRALQRRGRWRTAAGPAELDLAALLRDLAPLLRDTVSRSVGLDWRIPPTGVWILGRRDEVELLFLVSAQRLLRDPDRGGTLRIELEERDEKSVDLLLELEGPASVGLSAGSDWDAVVAEAASWLARRCGAERREDAGAGRVRLRFAPAPDEL